MGRKSKNKNRKIQEKVAENSMTPTLKIEDKVEENTKKLTPNVDEKVSENSNIEVLRRTDQSIEEFLIKADYVELCEFDVKAREWGVRGGLYLVKRSIEPQYQVIVFNGQDQGKFVDNIEDMEISFHDPYLFYRSKAFNKRYWIQFRSSPEFSVTPTFIRSSPRWSQPKDQTTRSESQHEKGGAQSSSMAEVLQGQLVRDSTFWKFVDAVVKIGMNCSKFWMPEHNSCSSTSTTVAASPTRLLSPRRFIIPDSSAPTGKDCNSIGGSSKGINFVVNTSTTTSPSSLVRTNTLSQSPIISKDEIRTALQNLIQEDAFISMVSDALEKALD